MLVTELALDPEANRGAVGDRQAMIVHQQGEDGLRMPGVTVEIRNDQTNDVRTTVSNEVGLFTMPALPLGKYTLRLALEGFATVERVGIQLQSATLPNRMRVQQAMDVFAAAYPRHADPQVLLQRVFATGTPVTRFELVRPSLHQIFLKEVGATGVEEGMSGHG